MNQDNPGASRKIGRLREKFFGGLGERVAEAQHQYEAPNNMGFKLKEL